MGNFAGEVDNPKRNYPLGITLAVVLVALNYVVPVVVGVGLSSTDWSLWQEGYLVTVAKQSAGSWLGIWMFAAGLASACGIFNVVMSSSARTMHRTARLGMLPGGDFFAKEWGRFNSPVAAILFL